MDTGVRFMSSFLSRSRHGCLFSSHLTYRDLVPGQETCVLFATSAGQQAETVYMRQPSAVDSATAAAQAM